MKKVLLVLILLAAVALLAVPAIAQDGSGEAVDLAQAMSIDKIGLAIAIVALIREHVPGISGSVTTLIAIAVCVGVHYGAPYIPEDLYTLILAVVGPMGGYAAGKQLLGHAGSKIYTSATPPGQ